MYIVAQNIHSVRRKDERKKKYNSLYILCKDNKNVITIDNKYKHHKKSFLHKF